MHSGVIKVNNKNVGRRKGKIEDEFYEIIKKYL